MIIGVDKVQSRLDLAKELGATHVINTSKFSSLTEDLVQAVREIAPSGSNASFDTTGITPIIDAGVQSLHLKGQMVLIGVVNGNLNVDIGKMLTVSVIVHTSCTILMDQSGTAIRGCIEGSVKPTQV